MLENLPAYISIIFGLTTLATLYLFYRAVKNSRSATTSRLANSILFGLISWLVIQAVLTLNKVYNADTDFLPPKILLVGILPTIITIILLFMLPKGREFIDNLSLKTITYLHLVRIPVELVLFWLFLHKAVPQLMTFEGRNFDILAGLTAPLIAYFGLTKNKLNRQILLIWNFICLALLTNIVVNALFSAPSPLQQFALDQPNIAILYFPFSWLPTFIVPVVLFSHLTAIRQLLQSSSRQITGNLKPTQTAQSTTWN